MRPLMLAALVPLALACTCERGGRRPAAADGAPSGSVVPGSPHRDATPQSAAAPPAADARPAAELPQGQPLRLLKGDECGLWEDGSVWCWGTCPLKEPCYPERLELAQSQRGVKVKAVYEQGECVLLENGDLLFRRRARAQGTFCRPAVLGRYKLLEFEYGVPESCLLTLEGRVLCWTTPRLDVWQEQPNLLDQVEPRQVLDGVTQLDGLGTFCAVRKDGSLWCWGYNASGQLGDGTSLSRDSPRPVQGLPPVSQAALGSSHVCALTLSSEVYCWGNNTSGQLGIGKIPHEGHYPHAEAPHPHDYPRPQRVEGLSEVANLMLIGSLSCAHTFDRSIYCWGSYAGEKVSSPRIINVVPAVQLVSTGYGACFLTEDRKTRCWGSSSGYRAASKTPIEVNWQGMPPLR